jgi:hypothetical protein
MKDVKKRPAFRNQRKLAAVLSALGLSMLCTLPAYAEASVITKGQTMQQAQAAAGSGTAEGQTAAAAWSGWKKNGTVWNWYNEDGSLLADAVTPDGYYVNGSGAWFKTTQVFMDESFNIPDYFRTASSVSSMNDFLPELNRANKRVQSALMGKRIFHVYYSGVTYSHLDNKEESLMLSMYKDSSCDGWSIRVACNLGDQHNSKQASSIDYGVLRVLIGRFSHTPDQIADAIYESWQGSNGWKITDTSDAPVGDALIRCSVENGSVVYKIQRRKDGDL